MRLGVALVVFLKEMREMIRDKRVVLTAVIAPLVSVVLAMVGLSMMFGDLSAQRPAPGSQTPGAQEAIMVGVVRAAGSDLLLARLMRTSPLFGRGARTTFVEFDTTGAAKDAMARGECSVVLVPPSRGDALAASERTAEWLVVNRQGSSKSSLAAQAVTGALQNLGHELLAQRLRRHGMTEMAAEPVRVNMETYGFAKRVQETPGPLLLRMLLPYLMVLTAFFGGVPGAFDMVSGEKERGTLETLLVSPAGRGNIVLGKFLAVFTVCSIAAGSALFGVVFAVHSGLPAFRPLFGPDTSLSAGAVGAIVLAFLPLNTLFAAILLTVSTFARNQKEAQTYLTPLGLIVVVPAMFTLFSGFSPTQPSLTSALIPVYNSSTLIRLLLSDPAPPALFPLVTIASSALYAALALILARQMFTRERVLMRI